MIGKLVKLVQTPRWREMESTTRVIAAEQGRGDARKRENQTELGKRIEIAIANSGTK